MSAQHSGPILAQRAGLTVIDCRACGWAHLDPLPAVPAGYYESEFWETKGAGWLAKYEAQRDWLDMRHGDWLSLVEEHTTAGRTLLDVGCGYGFLLQQAKVRGWGCGGIDLSQEAVTYARQQGLLVNREDWPGVGGTYSCISALWLMEHLPDPLAFLGWARAHLAPGGVLLLCVPQEWTHYQYAANHVAAVHDFFVHPTHLHYWSAASFYSLLGRAGFRVVDALASYPMERFINNGRDYTADEAVGADCHAEVRAAELERTPAMRLAYQRSLARQAIGRDLVVVCK